MEGMNPQVDKYLADGCMRCSKGGTPQCKVHNWPEELVKLRTIILECGLTEELKWGVPCYTYQNKNVLIMSAFKEYCALSFFKGVLLKDPKGILAQPGEHTQATRLIRFTSLQEIIELEPILKAYISEAIEVEKAGLKVELKETKEYDVPEEFQAKLDQDPALKIAFEALTPGRQRAYLLHFAQPKQSKTREARVEKNIPKIMEGKGFYD